MTRELDPREIILQRYVIEILNELKKPKRYGELQLKIRTRRTLSAKLSKLKAYGLIVVKPILMGNRYVSSYSTTEKGKKILKLLEKI